MEKTLKILQHIHELYVENPSENYAQSFAERNPEKIAAWSEAFKAYDLADILTAIDEYWNYKNNKTSPRVQQILAILNSKKEVVKDPCADVPLHGFGEENEAEWKRLLRVDPARAYYERDMATKPSSEVHALVFYRRVLADVITFKVETLPNAGKMSYGEKIAIVMRNGWLDDITEQVDHLARESAGYNPASAAQASKTLASHWRVGA